MAQTTTSTQADMILAELLAERRREADYANIVALPHCSFDSIFGQPSLTKNFPVNADLGAAAAGTEGTELTTVTTASLGTQASATPTEGATDRMDVTYRAIRRAVPGLPEIHGILQSNNVPAVMNVLAGYFGQQASMCFEKVETDVGALLDDFSTAVGSTTVDLTMANLQSAILSLTNNDTGREQDWVFLLAPAQVNDLRGLLTAGTGVSLAQVFSTNVQDIITVKPDLPRNGLQGSLFGIPVYQTATSINADPNSGADVAGALMVSGRGMDPLAPGGEGALLFLEGEPLHHMFQDDITERHVELVSIWEYAAVELRDAYGISIITDA